MVKNVYHQLSRPWEIVVLYPDQSVEREESIHFGELLSSSRVHRFYEREEDAGRKALQLARKGRERISDEIARNGLIDLIETILVYKLPQCDR